MRLPVPRHWLPSASFALVAFAGSAWLTGCTPDIGDSCVLSTDCASDGTRVCDTSEPGGYCTVLNCTGNNLGSVCPDNALCVEFFPNVPGCPDSVRSQSRTGISECRDTCSSDSDCRTDYFCRSPLVAPWNAEILDTDQTALICIPLLVFIDGGTSPVSYGYTGAADAVPPVCQATGPSFDAGFPPLDAAADAGSDAQPKKPDAGKRDAATDAKKDSTVDAGHADGATDGARDGAEGGHRDGGVDGSVDGAKDASSDAVHDAADAG
jgi:hypothetical protein